MAGFEGTQWATRQMRYQLKDRSFDMLSYDAGVYGVSRSIHYGLFLAFEGIRFYAKKTGDGKTQLNFVNLQKNLHRFRRSMSFNLATAQQDIVPEVIEIEDALIKFFRDPEMHTFASKMADNNAQGYLRPYTVDESLSIGVTFPDNPAFRAVACSYERYLGEPFTGVVTPHLVRAMGINGTGNLKLGVNYLMSVKAVDAAKQWVPGAASALFLDDQPHLSLVDRKVTEWDSSCCLFALTDGTVVKIPESPLILPSVTIGGICAILRDQGINIVEREITYGELIERSRKNEIVAVCSIGTAGILNRAQRIVLTDMKGRTLAEQHADEKHELYKILGDAKTTYWDIFREKAAPPEGVTLNSFIL
ncbi:aminotransferase class IV [bacterium]|nr:aminotransferase class IV [bacterium]